MASQINVDRIAYTTEGGENSVLVSELVKVLEGRESSLQYSSITDMVQESSPSEGQVAVVSDPVRGGLFFYSRQNDARADGGVVFASGNGKWIRLREDPSTANVAWYGVGRASVQAAANNNKRIRLQQGARYTFDRPVTSQGKDLFVELNGSIVERGRNNDEGCFVMAGGWSDKANITTSNKGASSGYPYIYTNIRLDVKKGDVVKMGSDRTYDYFKNNKDGEFAIVYNQLSSDPKIEFSSKYELGYSEPSDNPVVAKLSNAKLVIEGPGQINDLPGFSSQSERPYAALVSFDSCHTPEIHNVDFNNIYNDGVRFHSCWNHRASGLNWNSGYDTADGNDFEGSGFGAYGIRVVNGEGGQAWNCTSNLLRHTQVVIGSGTSDSTGTNGMSGYGPCRNTIMRDTSTYDCSTASYDTHHGQVNTQYINCHSYNCRGSAFSARGIGTTFEGCTSNGDKDGAHVFTQSSYEANSEAYTDNTLFANCHFYNSTRELIRVGEDSGRVVFEGGSLVCKDSSITEISYFQRGSILEINNFYMRLEGTLNGFGNKFFSAGSGTPALKLKNVIINVSTSSDLSSVNFISNKVSVRIDNLIMESTEELASLFEQSPTAGSTIGMVDGLFAQGVRGSSNDELIQNNFWKGPIQPNRYTSWGKMAYDVK